MTSSASSIEIFIGKMLLDDSLRREQAHLINLDTFQDKELYIIVKEMQSENFSVENMYLKYYKQLVVRCIDLVLAAKNQGRHG